MLNRTEFRNLCVAMLSEDLGVTRDELRGVDFDAAFNTHTKAQNDGFRDQVRALCLLRCLVSPFKVSFLTMEKSFVDKEQKKKIATLLFRPFELDRNFYSVFLVFSTQNQVPHKKDLHICDNEYLLRIFLVIRNATLNFCCCS